MTPNPMSVMHMMQMQAAGKAAGSHAGDDVDMI
jgi:hypothetical protein